MERINEHPVLPVPEDRKKVKFIFDGKEVNGYEGEMVSSALIAEGVKIFSIHQKGDSPHGIYCANGQCSHCTLMIDGFPLKSCVTPLKEGMDVHTLHHLPDLPEDDKPLAEIEKKIAEVEKRISRTMMCHS